MPNHCDVHVIYSDYNKQYHNQCFGSLENEPINLHIVPAVEGNIGSGRYRGFNSGTAEFVSYVDDDDYVITGIFEKCYKALDDNPDVIGVVTQESNLRDGEIVSTSEISMDLPWINICMRMHHLVMFRRDMIIPFVRFMKDCKFGSEYMLLIETFVTGHRYALVDEVGYIWRLHGDAAHKSMEMTEDYRQYVMELIEFNSRSPV